MTMFLTWPVLASLMLVMPAPGQRTADTIVRAASSASEASMHLELFVAPDRRILTCRMLHVQPPDAPVERVCQRLTGKKIDKGAKGTDGQPIHAVSDFVFTLDRRPGYRPAADFRVEVSALPGDPRHERGGVAVFVDGTGLVTDCHELSIETKVLAELACPRLMGTQRGPRRGKNGEPVAYLDSVLMEMSVSSPSAR